MNPQFSAIGTTPTDNYSGDEWAPTKPIPNMLKPVESFRMELLPETIRPWIQDIAERMQCPPDFPAVGAMVALSSVIGRKACIKPKRFDDWSVIPNLWGCVVGRPGVMKSPALSEAIRPLERLAAAAGDEHKHAMREFEIQRQLAQMTAKAAEKKAEKAIMGDKGGNKQTAYKHLAEAAEALEIDAPALRRYVVNDATVEALGELLITNQWGIMAYRDELHGMLRSLDREGQEGARTFFLQGYDGNQPYTFDRIGRGKNRRIEAVCLSLLGGIQPGKLESYIRDAVSGGAADDGLLQRFGLLVWPDVSTEWRNVDRWPETAFRNAAFEVFQRLDSMQPATDPETNERCPQTFRFDENAQTIFEDWRARTEPEIRAGGLHPALESHLSKYRKLVPALALVIALADGYEAVADESLLRAIEWAHYLRSHAERAYSAGTRADTEGAAYLLAKIRAGAVSDGFKPADVYLKGWAKLNTPEAVHAAANVLCDLGHLRRAVSVPGLNGGRPSITYEIHPEHPRAATQSGNPRQPST